MKNVIQYESNNSGGRWWLSDNDWHALEEAGWVVHWIHESDDPSHEHAEPEFPSFLAGLGGHHHGYDEEHALTKVEPSGERWLGALARSAAKATTDPSAAVAEFERVTGQNASDVGCNCCGEPHNFTFHDAEGNHQYSSAVVTDTSVVWS